MKKLNVFNKLILFSPVLFLLLISKPYSQMIMGNDRIVLDDEQRKEAIDSIANLIKDNYVFPDIAERMSEVLKSNLKNGSYDKITDPVVFAQAIADDLHKINNDKHLRVTYDPKFVNRYRSRTADSMSLQETQFKENLKYDNYGFYKVERLKGNIGYLDFRMFAPVELAQETVESVMGFLSNCDAIIFDLRSNGGGEPEMVRLICSYFFGPDTVHLNDLYFRRADKTIEFWTLPELKGKRMPNVPLYILTSKYTFSGAEEFTYNMKNLKRATIIGEITGGGANPGSRVPANKYFAVFIPTGRAINPYTKTNWEGTGVKPDIEVTQDKALTTAMNEAVKKLMSKTTDGMKLSQLKWQQEDLEAQLNPYNPDASDLSKYTGDYGDRHITFENGNLYYERKNISPKMKMIPMKEDIFKVENLDFFRVRFIRNEDGSIKEIEGLYDDGMTDTSPKTS